MKEETLADDIALDYGAIVDLMPGEDIKLADPKRPNQAFSHRRGRKR